MSLVPARLSRAALLVAGVLTSLIACSGSDSSSSRQTVTQPPPPPPPKPTIVVSSDSVAATLIAGAPKTTQAIDITAGTTTALAALTVADVSVTTGQPITWISATVSAQTAPAKLVVTIDPNVPAGSYSAVVHVGATDADIKSVRVSLVMKPRPMLIIDTTAMDFRGELGASLGARTIHITSVNGAIDSLSVSKLDCGSSTPAWLTPTLSGATTPATIKLEATPGPLKAGSCACSFVLSTTQTLVDSASQTVRASLTLVGVPKLVVSVDTVRASAFRRMESQPFTVSVTNGGTGTLDGLSVGQISYGPGASNSLTASLDQSSAPATLTVTPTAVALGPGLYTANVSLLSSMDGVSNNPAIVPV